MRRTFYCVLLLGVRFVKPYSLRLWKLFDAGNPLQKLLLQSKPLDCDLSYEIGNVPPEALRFLFEYVDLSENSESPPDSKANDMQAIVRSLGEWRNALSMGIFPEKIISDTASG
jgi:hypothetical protein